MRISSISATVNAGKYFRVLRIGKYLLNKKDKTEEEFKAAESFSKVFKISNLFGVVVGIIAIIMAINTMAIAKEGVKRNGTFEDGQVRYAKGTMQYVSPDIIGLGGYVLIEGEKVVLYFDSVTDALIGALPVKVIEKEIKDKMISLSIVFIVLIFSAIVLSKLLHNTAIGKPFYDWCAVNKIELS